MDKLIQENIEHILFGILLEQGAPEEGEAGGGKLETDNAPSSDPTSPFTPAEQKFLGKFDAYGAQQLGIIYSISDEGIREFMNRSGKELNCTTGILLSLLRDGIIKIVPYTGYGRNVDYTIELQLSLDDVKGMGAEDKEKAEAGSSASGAPAGGGAGSMPPPPPPPPGPTPSEWVLGYGDLLNETIIVTSRILNESKKSSNVQVKHSRILKDLPKKYIDHLNAIIDTFGKKKYSVSEKQRLIADVLDTLMLNFDLTPKQIQRSYEMHRDQKRLKKFLDEK
jgi:hypothetical protein